MQSMGIESQHLQYIAIPLMVHYAVMQSKGKSKHKETSAIQRAISLEGVHAVSDKPLQKRVTLPVRKRYK